VEQLYGLNIAGKNMRVKIGNRVFTIGFMGLDRFAIGIDSTSFCENGKQILMLDYDDKKLKDVIKDCKKLQKKYDLPKMYIYQSSVHKTPHHNVFCFTPLDFEEHSIIVFDADVDFRYKEMFLINGFQTLRITAKKGVKECIPKLIKVLKSKSKRKELKNGAFIVEKLLEKEREYGRKN
jgi:hypothetical protein